MTRTPIKTDDPHAIARLSEKLKNLEDAQASMKEVNKDAKRLGWPNPNGDNIAWAEIERLWKQRCADRKTMLAPGVVDHLRRGMEATWNHGTLAWRYVPFPAWQLTNNSAEIRRCKARIAEIERLAEVVAPQDIEGNGYRIAWDAEDAKPRVRIYFDTKPPEGLRSDLKGNGFKWSPSTEAWQRSLNETSWERAKYICAQAFDQQTAA